MSIDRVKHTATVIGSGPRAGWILIVGNGSADLYNPMAGTFMGGSKMVVDLSWPTATTIPTGANAGKILYAGGEDFGGATELYDPEINAFEPGPAMNAGRWDHTATVIASGSNADKILVVGGWLANKGEGLVPLASTELYDPASNRFAPSSATASMKVARGGHTATLIGPGANSGKILIAGGEQDDKHFLSSTELYDPATNRFEPGPPMQSPRVGHIAITIASGPNAGKILIAGGEGFQCDKIGCWRFSFSSTEIYDPLVNRFIPGPDMRDAPGDMTAVQLPASPLR
ncbi:MAG TPA: kelch repeat-containing protein [Candidatus Binataceae bacterium]|nr:kelch repeat-containing protein [Candidatus Binataceae bacterium]